MAASKQQTPKHGSGHRHPPELRERAVRMVEENHQGDRRASRRGDADRSPAGAGLGDAASLG